MRQTETPWVIWRRLLGKEQDGSDRRKYNEPGNQDPVASSDLGGVPDASTGRARLTAEGRQRLVEGMTGVALC